MCACVRARVHVRVCMRVCAHTYVKGNTREILVNQCLEERLTSELNASA